MTTNDQTQPDTTQPTERRACGPDATTWFARRTWPQCRCGFAPRDNATLNAHWAESGFAVIDKHGFLVTEKIK